MTLKHINIDQLSIFDQQMLLDEFFAEFFSIRNAIIHDSLFSFITEDATVMDFGHYLIALESFLKMVFLNELNIDIFTFSHLLCSFF